jgi:hypothetical protein
MGSARGFFFGARLCRLSASRSGEHVPTCCDWCLGTQSRSVSFRRAPGLSASRSSAAVDHFHFHFDLLAVQSSASYANGQ